MQNAAVKHDQFMECNNILDSQDSAANYQCDTRMAENLSGSIVASKEMLKKTR